MSCSSVTLSTRRVLQTGKPGSPDGHQGPGSTAESTGSRTGDRDVLTPAQPSPRSGRTQRGPRGQAHGQGGAPLPVTMRVVVLTAWPSAFSATALYWPLSSGQTLGMTSEHTPSTLVLYTAGFPSRLWPSLNQVTWGRGQPRTAQLMQHSQPGGSRCGRRPTRNQGFWLRSGSRPPGAFAVLRSVGKTGETAAQKGTPAGSAAWDAGPSRGSSRSRAGAQRTSLSFSTNTLGFFFFFLLQANTFTVHTSEHRAHQKEKIKTEHNLATCRRPRLTLGVEPSGRHYD